MKYIIILLCLSGCASTPVNSPSSPVPFPPPPAEVLPCPPIKTCSDQILMLDSDALAKGFSCPNNSQLVFPSVYLTPGKVLVLCQCK